MKKTTLLLVFVLLFAALLVGCGSAAPAEVEEEVAAPTTVVEQPAAQPTQAPEPTAVPTEVPAPPAEVDLDPLFADFLAAMKGYNTITVDQLNERLIAGDEIFLLDVREASELTEKGWIENAVHIPLREVAANLQYLPSFDTEIVTYCGSGWRCTIVMPALQVLGWEKVLALKTGSFGGWLEKGFPIVTGEIPTPEALNAAQPDPAVVAKMDAMLKAIPQGYGGVAPADLSTELIENTDIVLIDVRTAGEVTKNGQIPYENDVNIPLEELVAQIANWPAQDAEIVVYCGSGHRSTIAMSILWSYGYTNVRSMKDGFAGWTTAGLPVDGGKNAVLDEGFTRLLTSMTKYNTLTMADFNTMLAEEQDMFILDVRETSELTEKGWIPEAVHIPLRELGANLDKLPSFDTTIVSYCGSGWRCTIAMTYMAAMGWEDTLALKDNSFGGWVEAGYPVETGTIAAPAALNAAEPDPTLAGFLGETFTAIPEGWGIITPEDLNLKLAEMPDVTVIDVRTAAEVADKGVIAAENITYIPLEEFVAQRANWPADKAEQIVVYCGSGHRSTMAMSMLWAYGYTNVLSMKGGFAAWTAAGLPVGVAP